ncbi:MAG: LETM1 domain-containing protein [Bacteroidales bacterium]|nr:LETM1 domain-containing protein [Bacteroidales bacterium]
MDPSAKNWLPLCIDGITENVQAHGLPIPIHKTTADFAHCHIHTTGLFYGKITEESIAEYRKKETWSISDSFKITLTQSLFLTFFRWKQTTTINTEIITDCLQHIHDFYMLFTLGDNDNKRYRSIFSKDDSLNELVEQLINQRTSNPTLLHKTFWKGVKFNLFASLDVLYFALWLDGIYGYDKRKDIEKDCISLVLQAASITQDKNAKAIATYLSAAVGLEEQDENECQSVNFDKYTNDNIHIRRILYDYATFACFSDNNVQVNEVLFLVDVAKKLNLTEDDTQLSHIYVENYLRLEGNKLFYIHYSEGLDKIRQALFDRTQNIIQKNKQKITTEILESKELVELIRKSINEDLSTSEKDKVREQIFDLLKTIPSLAIFMIPGGAFILPIILKILPEEVLMPSSFINKKKEQ